MNTISPLRQTWSHVVVGSGIAGLLSAIHASKKGSVLLITKGKLKECNTRYAQGGIAAVESPKDSFKKHIEDTMEAGHFLNNRKAVEFIIKKGPAAIKELSRLGIDFKRNANGNFDLKLEGGHSEKRIVYYKDKIGLEIENALIRHVKKIKRITILENTFVKDLKICKDTRTCLGVEILKNSKPADILGRRTILATGGTGQLYLKTSNPQVATGDGIAMAHRAGGKISGMEFIQFHPTALDGSGSPLFLLSETLRGEGAKLLNEKGRRFMKTVHPLAELAPRDIISRTMIKQGRCYLDLRHIPVKILQSKFPGILAELKKSGKNPSKKPVPVTPVAHYLCGGIVTDLRGCTNIKNLYAVGECANTGLHGSNRLASNSLLEAAIMAKQVTVDPLPAFHPARISAKSPSITKIQKKIPKVTIPSKITSEYRKELQTSMWQNAGIIRSEKSLKKVLKQLESIKKSLAPLHQKFKPAEKLFELQNMAEVCALIVKASIRRKKSIGTHYRTD